MNEIINEDLLNKTAFDNFLPIWKRNIEITKEKIRYARSVYGLIKLYSDNVPAVVIGAGPSLDKNISVLAKYKDKAITICTDIVYKKLSEYYFSPNFCVTIDAQPIAADYIKGMRKTKTLLIAPTVISPEFLENWKGNRAFFNIRYENDYCMNIHKHYDIPIRVWLPTGNIVANFGAVFAFMLGCNPIIMIGNDLSYPGLKTYSNLASKYKVNISNKFNTTETIMLNDIYKQKDLLYIPDIYNRQVLTRKEYIVFHNWLADNVYPHRIVANCTEGGISRSYIIEPLESFLSPYPKITKTDFYEKTKISKKTKMETFYL